MLCGAGGGSISQKRMSLAISPMTTRSHADIGLWRVATIVKISLIHATSRLAETRSIQLIHNLLHSEFQRIPRSDDRLENCRTGIFPGHQGIFVSRRSEDSVTATSPSCFACGSKSFLSCSAGRSGMG